ncbi:hypothetical protein GXW78_02930 [Roseomonas terrae]|jgi:hypothetical protein|uniref:Uncharacterized protein n=1 Tax=Neoroseomonas terrae TaxID=424799 RepID=A0ABS5EC51_9PROT|nr:hypothetical protein [Neoroseomonas terrae]
MTRPISSSGGVAPVARCTSATVPKDQVLGRLAWIKTAPIAELKSGRVRRLATSRTDCDA